jgi:CBS domain-containing protein
MGSGFGLVLILLGLLFVLTGGFVAGMWWFLIGMFLRGAARMSYEQLVTREALRGEKVRRFMKTEPVTVPSSTPVNELVDDYVYRYHHKLFPVTEDGRLAGCVTTREIKEIPREEWESRSVSDAMIRCTDRNTISPDADALDALAKMRREHSSRLLVVDGDRLLGVLTLKDLLAFLSLKVELEEDGGGPRIEGTQSSVSSDSA